MVENTFGQSAARTSRLSFWAVTLFSFLVIPLFSWQNPHVRFPRTSDLVGRMNRTLLDECFRVEGRKTWYENTDQIQVDLDRFLEYYNLRRTHQGYRLQGRTPIAALCDALQLPVEQVSPLATPLQESEANDDTKEAA